MAFIFLFKALNIVKPSCSVGRYIIISGREHSRKLKFSMQSYLTHINIIFEYCQASVIIDNVDVLYLEDRNVYTRLVLKKQYHNHVFFSKNLL